MTMRRRTWGRRRREMRWRMLVVVMAKLRSLTDPGFCFRRDERKIPDGETGSGEDPPGSYQNDRRSRQPRPGSHQLPRLCADDAWA